MTSYLPADGRPRHPHLHTADYRRLFPSPPSEKLKPIGGSGQNGYVKGILRALDEDEELDTLDAFKPAIVTAMKNLKKATERRDELQVTETRAANALQIVLAEGRAAYNQAWHRLNVMFPRDKALVESFFRPLSARDRGREVSDVSAPVPAPPVS